MQARNRVLLDDGMMREILADVGQMRTALELELWASWMLGQIWKQRVRLSLFAEVDWMLILGSPMLMMIVEIGGARARKALTAISMLDRGALGNYAGALALTLPGAQTPEWMADIAGARLSGARRAAAPGEGEAVLLELCRGEEHELCVAVFIDHRNDGMVKWIRVLGPVSQGEAEEMGGSTLEPADLDAVARGVLDAIARTDTLPPRRVQPEYADLRAFLRARLVDAAGSSAR